VKCPYCGSNKSSVLDSRDTEDSLEIRRRRECVKCLHRFTTYESYGKTKSIVEKIKRIKDSVDELMAHIEEDNNRYFPGGEVK
jgi:transcriptional regulator NrdR family protein